MNEKRLQRMKRAELLELLLAQSREIERLTARVSELEQELGSREVAISSAGNLAEASLKLTNIFVEAQRAADVYLYNVQRQSGFPAQPPVDVYSQATVPRHAAPPQDENDPYGSNPAAAGRGDERSDPGHGYGGAHSESRPPTDPFATYGSQGAKHGARHTHYASTGQYPSSGTRSAHHEIAPESQLYQQMPPSYNPNGFDSGGGYNG